MINMAGVYSFLLSLPFFLSGRGNTDKMMVHKRTTIDKYGIMIFAVVYTVLTNIR